MVPMNARRVARLGYRHYLHTGRTETKTGIWETIVQGAEVLTINTVTGAFYPILIRKSWSD